MLSATPGGAATTKYQTPRVPYTAEEFVDTVAKYRKEGASIVHIYCRRPDTGAHTPDLEIIGNELTATKRKTPGYHYQPPLKIY
jgi:3-keto-5-aminohexanoate cleavage enzyme